MGFTKIDNQLLDSDNGLDSYEFRVLISIYRLTKGYHRKSYPISYAQLTLLSGVKKISPIIKRLVKKGYIRVSHQNGSKNIIEIIPVHQKDDSLSTKRVSPPTPEVSPLSFERIGYRGAKENLKENLKENSKEMIVHSKRIKIPKPLQVNEEDCATDEEKTEILKDAFTKQK